MLENQTKFFWFKLCDLEAASKQSQEGLELLTLKSAVYILEMIIELKSENFQGPGADSVSFPPGEDRTRRSLDLKRQTKIPDLPKTSISKKILVMGGTPGPKPGQSRVYRCAQTPKKSNRASRAI